MVQDRTVTIAMAREERDGLAATSAGGPHGPVAGAGHRPHLAYLDGLRGIAILLVLAIHASQLVAGLSQPVRDLTFYGVRGVQLFFVVSGFTLTIAHAARPLEPLNFAARRFFRIAPMFYLGAVLYLALAHATAMPLPTRDASATDVVATLLFVHGWVPSAINTVVPGGWSIAAEAMFYLVFPMILALVPRPRLLAGTVAASYLVAGLTNIALRKLVGGSAGEALAFPFWLVQLPAFVGGCWLATLPAPDRRRRALAPWIMALAAAGMVADSQLRGHSNLLVAILLLTALTWAAGAARPRWLEARPLTYLGRISFSFYVVHFAVLGAIRPFAPAIERALGAEGALLAIAVLTLAVAGAISTATFHGIEQPIIRRTRQWGRARR